MSMSQNSFSFGGVNSFDEFKIKATSYDTIEPPKRQRYQQIPFSSIPHNYGAKYFDQRIIKVHCTMFAPATRSEVREIPFWLYGQKRLVFWDEPENIT